MRLEIKFNTIKKKIIMKKITLLMSLTFMLISGYSADAQCTITGNLDFRSQTDIDNWVPPCSQISVTGFVNVQGATITNISKLANIVQIGAYLQFRTIAASVTSFAPLSNITSIGGALVIRDCDGITSIAPLSGLTSLGGAITIRDNLNLTSFSGLGNLVNPPLTGGVTIFNNAALTDISAINYSTINGLLEINSNPALTSLGTLSSITSITGLLKIKLNSLLTDLSGLSGLTTVGGNVEVDSNNALTSISGLSGLTSATGSLLVRTNPLLTNLTGLDNLASVGAVMEVTNNLALRNLCGLNALVASNTFTSYVVTGNGYNPLVSNFPSACEDPTLSTPNFKSFGFLSYPNPVKDQLNISVYRESSYIFSNTNGQAVATGKFTSGNNFLNTSELAQGIYIITINDTSGFYYSGKILKE